jgi:hypothetical protein
VEAVLVEAVLVEAVLVGCLADRVALEVPEAPGDQQRLADPAGREVLGGQAVLRDRRVLAAPSRRQNPVARRRLARPAVLVTREVREVREVRVDLGALQDQLVLGRSVQSSQIPQ